jgi:hypothetical protein
MKSVLALGTALVLAFAAPASAATLTVDGGWSLFGFGPTGSAIYDVATETSTYNFTLTENALLNVTDAFDFGDTFSFFNNGVALASTGTFDSINYTNNADVAFAGTSYAKFSVLLSAGSYSLTGIATASPQGQGGAFVQLASVPAAAVPEPATWGMMLVGFGVVGAGMRRRKSVVVTA